MNKETLNGNHRAAAADLLRVVSIAVVAWYHFWQQSWLNPNFELFGHTIDIYPIIRCGYMFVYNLILISGFLLMLNRLSGRYQSPAQFYKSRAKRILPSYLFCIAVFLILSNQPGGTYDYSGGEAHMRMDLISHLTFTHNLFAQSYNATGLNVALWTLAVEVQFYLLFPILSEYFAKKPLLTYAAMVLISIAGKAYVQISFEDSTLHINRLVPMLDVFANGMLAACIYDKLKNTSQPSFIHFPIALAACVGMVITVRDISYIGGGEEGRMAQMWGASVFSAYGAFFLVSGSLCHGSISFFLSNPPIRFLGGISYNFYIWHQPVAVWLKKLHIPDYTEEYPNMSGNVVWQHRYMLICALAALLVAVAATYLIEKPCARLFSAHKAEDKKKPAKESKRIVSPDKL